MKAVLCNNPGRLTLIDRPDPIRGEDEVLIRIRRVGVCGTDYHIFHGNQPYLSYPRVMGHELGGTVEEAPKGSRFACGDVVSIEPYLYCGTCRACRNGRTNCCRSLSVLGVHRDGGLCEFVSVPERNVVPAEGLELDHAAMVEFLAIGAHGVRRSGIRPGQEVAIVGAGPIGIAASIFAKAQGGTVTVVDMNPRRLAFCRDSVGVDRTVEAGPDATQVMQEATGGEFFDVVIDATGSPAAMEAGFGLVGHGGTYTFLSLVRSEIRFDDPEFHKRETTLLGSRNATRLDFETVIAAMRAGKVPLAALASHAAPLSDAPSSIPVWSRPEANVIKAIVHV